MRITQVTTKTGDHGSTQLVGGQEIPKDHPRVWTYGTIDELNALLGVVRSQLGGAESESGTLWRLDRPLRTIQNDLFNIGGLLATLPSDRWETQPRPWPDDVLKLETLIEGFNAELPPLEEFVLPGGPPIAAFLHQARTVCRRAERHLVTLYRCQEEDDESVLRYLNRLSDLLFVLSRWATLTSGQAETVWSRSR